MERKLGRGDVVWLDFTPTKGHEQSGRRPAVVLSPKEYNEKSGLFLVCPVTSKIKGYPFEVQIGGKITGAILVDQLRSVDWKERNAKYIETLPVATMAKVKRLLDLILP
ncbi:MAG TPA: type II toxin-antitoxin system PemK/MazF family toxin [Candidatus Nanoarchaeia archaeon]|nr:type II toxin-antitoxin system PemK/MazF family toxin [Candidatus Nanoarchaeia archaeon]